MSTRFLASGSKAPAALLALILAASNGCTTKTVVSTPLPDPSTENSTGTPGIRYFLPTSVVSIVVESQKDDKGKHKDMLLATTATLLPDPTAGFTLQSPSDSGTRKIHHIKLQDGMLTSVSTEDENQLDKIIGDIATVATNVLAFGGASGSAESLTLEPGQIPTNEEILAAYATIAPGPHKYSFPRIEDDNKALPGTQGLVVLQKSTTANAFGAPLDKPETATSAGSLDGIFARVLQPLKVEVKLSLRLGLLYGKRVTEYEAKVKTNKATLEQLGKDRAQAETDLAAARQAHQALEEARRRELEAQAGYAPDTPQYRQAGVRIINLAADIAARATAIETFEKSLVKNAEDRAKLVEANAKLEADIKLNRDWRDNGALKDRLYPVATHNAIILVPDETRLVRIPITRAPLGLSKNTVTLQSGILTEYRTEHPSAALEVLKIPVNITGKLLELPTKILQLKIDYSSKQKALVDAQDQLAKLEAKIAKEAADPTEHDNTVGALQKQKDVLQLEKDIATLRKAIADLAPKP